MGIMKLCEKLTYDYEKSKFKRLSFRNRRNMKKHLLVCKKCLDYVADSDILDVLLQKAEKSNNKYAFSENEKKMLKGKLKA